MKRIIISLICAVVAFASIYTGALGTIDKTAEDYLYHHASGVDSNIKIIKIDDKTMNSMGEFSTWSRDIYAQLVEKLCVSDEVRPAVIGFDILFSSNKNEDADLKFANACAKYNNVVTAFGYVFTNEIVSSADGSLVSNNMAVSEKILPYEQLKKVTEQGFVNAILDEKDGFVRSAFLNFKEKDGTETKSFSSAIYSKYMDFLGKKAEYKTDESVISFKYSGKPTDYENVSLIDVLNGTVPAEAFDNSIVLVGAYAAGMLDAYFVPVDHSTQMFGVEIQANIIEALMENKRINHVSPLVDAIVVALVVFALAFICDKLSAVKIVIACIALIIVKFASGLLLFNFGYSTNVLTLPVMTAVIAVYYIIIHYYRARLAKKSIEKAFGKYVAPQVVDEIAKDGKYELRLGGENRDVAVLFVDIRGFTTLSESLKPEEVVDILNGYLELTTKSIFCHGGTLDKFVGDATMAVFNSPFDIDDYVYKAIVTAWDIVEGGKIIEEKYLEKYGKHVGFGVGINCGPAVVGNIGCEFRMDYTAIGDTVNTAARLESNAPKGTIYISEAVYERVKDRITVEEVGEIPLKGKSNGVFVYSVTGVKDYVAPRMELPLNITKE